MYTASAKRYDAMPYRRCGRSGLKLPAVSLGLWHNFGGVYAFENMRELLRTAFDQGITHFDLANNYGPPPGSAEENFGRILKSDLAPYRDEFIISTKAGFTMWEGPYGDWGSRKYLTASLDASLKRMGLDYVDVFYHHRPDPETPLEETMLALDNAVRQGKALYVGLSNYRREQTRQALAILRELKTPVVLHQPSYSILNRWIEEDGLKDFAYDQGLGMITFSPLAQGLLTDRYLTGIPADSRAGSQKTAFLPRERVTPQHQEMAAQLSLLAKERGQSLAQMALAWNLRDGKVTSVLIGASKASQIVDCAGCVQNLTFTREELERIDSIVLSHMGRL